MRSTDIMILVATILSAMFPYHLINAIRNHDKEKADSSQIISCILFGGIIFSSLTIINS